MIAAHVLVCYESAAVRRTSTRAATHQHNRIIQPKQTAKAAEIRAARAGFPCLPEFLSRRLFLFAFFQTAIVFLQSLFYLRSKSRLFRLVRHLSSFDDYFPVVVTFVRLRRVLSRIFNFDFFCVVFVVFLYPENALLRAARALVETQFYGHSQIMGISIKKSA